MKLLESRLASPLSADLAASEGCRAGGTVILNVGGGIHQVKWETIDKFPKSRLQKLRNAGSESELVADCYRTQCCSTEIFLK